MLKFAEEVSDHELSENELSEAAGGVGGICWRGYGVGWGKHLVKVGQ